MICTMLNGFWTHKITGDTLWNVNFIVKGMPVRFVRGGLKCYICILIKQVPLRPPPNPRIS